MMRYSIVQVISEVFNFFFIQRQMYAKLLIRKIVVKNGQLLIKMKYLLNTKKQILQVFLFALNHLLGHTVLFHIFQNSRNKFFLLKMYIFLIVLQAACQQLQYGKVPSLCVLVKTFSPTETDSSIFFKDPTGNKINNFICASAIIMFDRSIQ
jgi:hypothetical protein